MNIISVHVEKNIFSNFELHLFEHVYVKKIEYLFKKNNIDNQGILINAETFISYCDITFAFHDKSLLKKIISIIEAVKFDKLDIEMFNIEYMRIKEEVKVIDITDEEKLIYTNFSINSKDIMALYECPVNFDVDNIMLKVNEIVSNINIYVFDGSKIYNYKKVNSEKINIITADKYMQNEEHLTFSVYFNVYNIKEYLIVSLMSFIMGKTSESIVDKFLLQKNNLYYGYTFDVTINGIYILSILLDKDVELSDVNKMFYIEFDKLISSDDFIKFRNTFITNFFLNEFPSDFFRNICNLNLYDTINIAEITKMFNSITFDDIINKYNDFAKKVINNYVEKK